jgi:hypothetical protein
MSEKSLGREEFLVRLAAKINDDMNLYFPPEQRLHRDLIPVFAENLLDQYPHEYVGDIGAFFARASMGRYGEQDRDGTVVKRGQTFGKLTMMTLAEWFRQYLGERAEEEERVRLRNHKSLNEVVAMDDKVLAAIKASSLNPDMDHSGKRIQKLLKYGAMMTTDQLSEAWKEATSAHERSLIMQEANKRGLVVKKIEEHLTPPTP